MKTDAGNNRRYGLARVLSKMGLASRTQAARWIAEGMVAVNGRTIHDSEFPVRMGLDSVTVGHRQAITQERIVLMLNKPRGMVTTRSDEKQRPTVYDCLPEDMPWLAPIGRLDMASEGLLLFSNDPVWSAAISDPETGPHKTYHVQINRVPDQELLEAFKAGLDSDVGFLRAHQASLLRHGDKNAWLQIVLDEGRNRHIRRMLQAFDISVLRLIRTAIGGLVLGDLAKGQCRQLNAADLVLLDDA